MKKRNDQTHQEIVKMVFDLVQADEGTYSKVKKEKQVNELKEKAGITYKPDVHAYAKRRKGRIDVYEIWHTESWAKAFLDIMNSLLISGIDWIHIVVVQRDKYVDAWEKNDVAEIKERLNQILKNSAREKLDRLVVVMITETDLRDKRSLREILKKKLL